MGSRKRTPRGILGTRKIVTRRLPLDGRSERTKSSSSTGYQRYGAHNAGNKMLPVTRVTAGRVGRQDPRRSAYFPKTVGTWVGIRSCTARVRRFFFIIRLFCFGCLEMTVAIILASI